MPLRPLPALASLLLSLACSRSPAPAAPAAQRPATSAAPRAHLGDDERCTVTDGTIAREGSSLREDDGCNTCVCSRGQWSCTEMACPR